MGNQYAISNEGVIGPYLTMDNDTTANMDFTNTDVAAGRKACVLAGNNKVGMGSDGDRLFGAVIAVSDEVDSSGIPERVTVQVRGVVTIGYVATTPVVGGEVEVDGAGKVSKSTAEASYPAGGHSASGIVINVNTTNSTCDILL